VSKPKVNPTDTVPDVPASESTPYRRLVEHVLGFEDICTYVNRRMGEGLSRRAVARELTERIGVEGVRISDTMLIRWCGGSAP
jgi:hypothetical protein